MEPLRACIDELQASDEFVTRAEQQLEGRPADGRPQGAKHTVGAFCGMECLVSVGSRFLRLRSVQAGLHFSRPM